MKKKALLSSVLTIALCISLIAGATFALFTSESKVNVAVTSGNVDVVATVENLALDTTLARGNLNETSVNQDTESNTITLNRIVPGDYVTFDIRIHNNSDIAVQYRTVITKVEDNGLWNGLVVTFDGVKYDGVNAVKTDWAAMEVGSSDIIVSVKIALPENVGNEYMQKSCKLAYTVEAVQGNADMPDEWDGTTTDEPTQDQDNANLYHISTAAQFMEVMEKSQNYATTNVYYNKTIVLDKNIDLCGATVTGFGQDGSHFYGSFDGQGYTVSNFTVKNDNGSGYYAGLFSYVFAGSSIKNLTVKNATIIGNGKSMAGAVVGGIYGDTASVVENCHAIDCTVYGQKKVGGVVGYANDGVTVSGCSATNCELFCEVGADVTSAGIAPQADEVVGFNNGATVNCADNYTNVNITFNATYVADGVAVQNGTYLISNANGLFWFDNLAISEQYDKNIKLVADIDLENRAWTPVCYSGTQYCGTFDGNGHTIYNLSITADPNAGDSEAAAMFAWSNGTIKNLTIDGATVNGNHYVATLVGYMQIGTVENCHIKNATVVNTHMDDDKCGDKAGALIAYTNRSCVVKDCSASNCTVTAARDGAQLIGYGYRSNTYTNLSVDNVTVTAAATGCSHRRAGYVVNDLIIYDEDINA